VVFRRFGVRVSIARRRSDAEMHSAAVDRSRIKLHRYMHPQNSRIAEIARLFRIDEVPAFRRHNEYGGAGDFSARRISSKTSRTPRAAPLQLLSLRT
jgi:hypothetical protein